MKMRINFTFYLNGGARVDNENILSGILMQRSDMENKGFSPIGFGSTRMIRIYTNYNVFEFIKDF